MLGEALELEFGVDLTFGPALEEGFYYDAYMGDSVLTEAEKPKIEKRMQQVCKCTLAHTAAHGHVIGVY